MKLVPITDIDAVQAEGMPFATVDSIRWEYRQREERGTAGAFFVHGRKVLVDPDEWHRLVREQKQVAAG